MSQGTLVASTLSATVGLVGCAGIDPGPDYDRASDLIQHATGAAQVYRPQDHESVDRRVRDLLHEGLTAAESVELALLHNPALQAAFWRIGIGRADVVQAGLLSNPSLSAAFRFPSGGGLTIIEAGIVQNLVDLWQIPVRRQAAEHELERTILEVARIASELGLKARSAYYAARAADAAIEVAQDNVVTAQELLDLALAKQGAGAGNEIDVNVARSDLLEQELALKAARLRAFEDRRVLATLLGLDSDPAQLLLADELPDPPAALPSVESLMQTAGEHRLDLAASRRLVEAAARRLRLEQRSVFSEVAAGVELEREGDQFSLGPALDLQLPIFDQNQAQTARAAYQYEEARNLLLGLTRSVQQDVRGAARRAETAWEVVGFYETELLPRRRTSLELAREAYQLGRTSFLSVLEAQQAFLGTRRDYIAAQRASAEAAVDLEIATGRPLVVLLENAADVPMAPQARASDTERTP